MNNSVFWQTVGCGPPHRQSSPLSESNAISKTPAPCGALWFQIPILHQTRLLQLLAFAYNCPLYLCGLGPGSSNDFVPDTLLWVSFIIIIIIIIIILDF
jgi:hypothetical protein